MIDCDTKRIAEFIAPMVRKDKHLRELVEMMPISDDGREAVYRLAALAGAKTVVGDWIP